MIFVIEEFDVSWWLIIDIEELSRWRQTEVCGEGSVIA
jgi:hypothetical protein